MNENDLNILLRTNKPVVKDDPAFMLKARQRMSAVEGIKNEVDRQRKHGLIALAVTLIIGVMAGILITVIFLLTPMDSIRALIGECKLYIEVAVSIIFTLIAIYLGNGISVFVRTIPVTSLYLRETGSRVP